MLSTKQYISTATSHNKASSKNIIILATSQEAETSKDNLEKSCSLENRGDDSRDMLPYYCDFAAAEYRARWAQLLNVRYKEVNWRIFTK